MNSWMSYPLGILLLIAFFSSIFTYDEFTMDFNNETVTGAVTTSQVMNETETDLEVPESSFSLDFTLTVGLIGLIAGAIAISLIGASVLGSHVFSDRGQKIFFNGVVFYGLWLIFSVLGYNFLAVIPIFGIVLWFGLTFCFTVGLFSRMGL